MEIASIESFLDYYEKVRQRTRRLVEIIPDEKMDAAPIPGRFTFADLVRHVAAIERHMYAENVQGKPSRYLGCGKALADGKSEVLAFFDRCHQESVAIFARLAPEDLNRKCVTPAGSPITVWKWLRLLPEHEIHHRGQLYSYLALVGVETPPLYGLTSEQVARASRERERERER
jgi:uncharacterized damage-inducible protein DinB